MPLIEKEVIRPGTYWYRDQKTGEPRKLDVTPELTKYWHEQGNAMLSSGLTVPVPCEHDFNAHPMTPAEKLKSNAGWVKGYNLRDGRLFSSVEIEDPDIVDKLPRTIRWTSPWINSFTDGNGKEWKNVISHLALTTRPRIVDQEPFGSVAAALSMAEPVKVDEHGDEGFCLSRAGLLNGDEPAYPMAFSMVAGIPMATDASGKEHGEAGSGKGGQFVSKGSGGKGGGEKKKGFLGKVKDFFSGKSRKKRLKKFSKGGSGHKALNESHAANKEVSGLPISSGGFAERGGYANRQSKRAIKSGSVEAHKDAADAHHKAHEHYSKLAGEGYSPKIKQALQKAAQAHKAARDEHRSHHGAAMSLIEASFGPSYTNDEKTRILLESMPFASMDDDDYLDDEDDYEDDEDDIEMDDDPTNDDMIDVPPEGPSEGDVSMVELLCDLLGALGIEVQQGGSEESFKRDLYNATMTKIHELTNKGDGKDPEQDPTKRMNPPGQPPNNPKPGQPGQNPLIQQEQQPMYMSLEDINRLDEPLKSVALSMYNETVKANAKAQEAEKVLNSLRDAKLKEAADARAKRVALLGKLSPRAKADLESMLAMPEMALSMGEGGTVVDPMEQTLAVLEKGLADMPHMLTTDQSALSVVPQPTDSDILDEEKTDEIADSFARQMGAPPQQKQAS